MCVVTNHEKSSDLLDRAAAMWGLGAKAHRDNKLEIGRILHKYLLAAMRERANLPSDERDGKKNSRTGFIIVAADRLGVSREETNDLIRVAMAADFLSPAAEFGEVGWATLRHLARYVKRSSFGKDPNAIRKELSYELHETWEVTTDFAEGQIIFNKAVSGEMTRAEIVKLIRPGVRGKVRGGNRQEALPFQPVHAAIKVACPRDAAELLYQTILANDDPFAVANCLSELIQSPSFERDTKEKFLRKRKTKRSA